MSEKQSLEGFLGGNQIVVTRIDSMFQTIVHSIFHHPHELVFRNAF